MMPIKKLIEYNDNYWKTSKFMAIISETIQMMKRNQSDSNIYFAFAYLVAILVRIMSFTIRLKIFAETLGIKKYKSAFKKKEIKKA